MPHIIQSMNETLAEHTSDGYTIQVDESRIDEAMEAWVPVLMKRTDEIEPSIQGFPDEMQAILIWENCD